MPEKIDTSTAAAPKPATPEKEREWSIGEQIFDFVVYKGIGFGVNEALSLFITDEFQYGVGKHWFDKWSESLAHKYPQHFKDTFENGVLKATGKQNAGNVLMTFALLNGGTLLLAPMMQMDKNKAAIVEWINHNFGSEGMSQEQIAERDREVREAIACEPRQTLGSMLPARAAAVGSTMLFGFKVMGDHGNKRVAKKTEGFITGALKKMGGHNEESALVKLAENPKFKRYAGLSGVEAIYCAITCVVVETVSKFLAGKAKEQPKKDPELCEEATHGPPAPADSAPPASASIVDPNTLRGSDGASTKPLFAARHAPKPFKPEFNATRVDAVAQQKSAPVSPGFN